MRFSLLTIATALVSSCFLFQAGCTKKCSRTLQEAPELRGFRLGTTTSDIQKRFPGFPNLTPNEFGLTKVVITPVTGADVPVKPGGGEYVLIDVSHYPELVGTDRIILQSVDGRVATIKTYYPKDVRWRSVDEFVQRTAEALNLPDGWDASNKDADYRHCFCDGFYVRAGMDHEKYDEEKLPFVELGDTMGSITPMLRNLNKNENENRKEDERRKTFKP